MKSIAVALTVIVVLGLAALAQQAPGSQPQAASSMPSSEGMMGMHHHDHASGAPVSFGELKDTVARLERARQATAKYQDARLAEADGYRAVGPDVPGMGIHYVLGVKQNGFDVEKPPILLYEKNPAVPGGFSLVGVSYLLSAAEGPDGQPVNSPFPKSLALWHRHENICVLPDRTTSTRLSEEQCREKGGHFTAETQWMVHAWIWKDSPLGVFSPTNPAVL